MTFGMDLGSLVDIAQIVAAVGVVASVIYFAIQLRQNTRAIRAQAYQSMIATTLNLSQNLFADEEFARFFVEVGQGGPRDEVEKLRWHTLMISMLRHFDNLLYQAKIGTLAPELWVGYDRVLASWLHVPALLEWYDAHPDWFSKDLGAWINARRTVVAAEKAL